MILIQSLISTLKNLKQKINYQQINFNCQKKGNSTHYQSTMKNQSAKKEGHDSDQVAVPAQNQQNTTSGSPGDGGTTDGQGATKQKSDGQEQSKQGDICIQQDGSFKFNYDQVVHAHNYQAIRDIPTGGYVYQKPTALQKFDPNDSIINLSSQQVNEKVQNHFKGIYQNGIFNQPLGADTTFMKLPKINSGHGKGGKSLDVRRSSADKQHASSRSGHKMSNNTAGKIKLKKGLVAGEAATGEHRRTLTMKQRNPLTNSSSPGKDDPVMMQYATARKQIKENIARAQAQIANQVNSADRLKNSTIQHVKSSDLNEMQLTAGMLATMEGSHMINKPSNLTSQQILGLGDTGNLPRGTTFSTLNATTLGRAQEENQTNTSTKLGINTLADAKTNKYRAQFRLHQNSAVNAKTFQRNTDSKDQLDSVSRGNNDTIDHLASKGDINYPVGTLSQIHSKSNQIQNITQPYGFISTRASGLANLQNTGSGPIPFIQRSALGTPDRFGQTQGDFYQKISGFGASPMMMQQQDEFGDMNRSMMEASSVTRPRLMRSMPQSAINKVATNINSVRDYKFHVFESHQEQIKRIHQKLMHKKQVSSGGNSSLNSIQRLLAPKLQNSFLSSTSPDKQTVSQNLRHNELFKDMNRLNGCFLDVIDNVCGYKVDLGIMLQRLVESYNSVFLQQYEAFYDGRLQKEKQLDGEISSIQELQRQTNHERDLLRQKQDLAEQAIQQKDHEIGLLESQVEHLEKQIEKLRGIIKQDQEEAVEQQAEADQKQAELDGVEFMAKKDNERNKRIALKANPMSEKLLMDPTNVSESNQVVEIAKDIAEGRNAAVERLYQVIKSMLQSKQKHQRTQTDQACMNNAIMYDYYSYGDSNSDKEQTKEINEVDEAAQSQDEKLKKLMQEKGIKIDEEDVDDGQEDDEIEDIHIENQHSDEQKDLARHGLKVDGSGDTQNRSKLSRESQRSSRSYSAAKNGPDNQKIQRIALSTHGSRQSNSRQNRKSPQAKQLNQDFDQLELPQTYHSQTLRQMGVRDHYKLVYLHDTLEKICLDVQKKKQKQGHSEPSDTTKMNIEVIWKIPFRVIAFVTNRIQQLEKDRQIMENYELMPWHQLKEVIFDLYDHRVKHTPELCGSVNTNHCSFNEHLMLYFVDKYRRRQKAEEKVVDIIINLRYYYDHWKRVQIYVQNLGFATRAPAPTTESVLEKNLMEGKGLSKKASLMNEFGDQYFQSPPHSYTRDDQCLEHDIYTQEFFLHIYSLLNHDRNNFVESREGKTWIRSKTHDHIAKRVIPLMKGPVGDLQKWSLKMRRLTRKIKNKDGIEYEYLDLDLILFMIMDDFKQQRILFQKEITKQFARNVEAQQTGLDLDAFMDMVKTSLPPTDETMALEHPLIQYPGQLSYVRAYIYACVAGGENGSLFSDDCFIAGASRFGLESPVASISTRCGFYGNSRDVMQILQDAEKTYGKPLKIDAKQFSSFTMGLPEKKNFKKRSTSTSKGRGGDATPEDEGEMRRKRTQEVNETAKTQLPANLIPAGLINMKMEFVEEHRNQGKFSPMIGEQEFVKMGKYKFKVQTLKKKAQMQEETDRIEMMKSAKDSYEHSGNDDKTDQKVPRSSKFDLTNIEIGMQKEIIVPSFRTTVDIFSQHFLILRELKHRINLLHQAYYSQMDKKKTWEQVNEIIDVLDAACKYLDFPEQKNPSKFMIRVAQEPEKRNFLADTSQMTSLSPKPLFLSKQLGVPKEPLAADGASSSGIPTSPTARPKNSVSLIQEGEEGEEDEESKEDGGEERGDDDNEGAEGDEGAEGMEQADGKEEQPEGQGDLDQ